MFKDKIPIFDTECREFVCYESFLTLTQHKCNNAKKTHIIWDTYSVQNQKSYYWDKTCIKCTFCGTVSQHNVLQEKKENSQAKMSTNDKKILWYTFSIMKETQKVQCDRIWQQKQHPALTKLRM